MSQDTLSSYLQAISRKHKPPFADKCVHGKPFFQKIRSTNEGKSLSQQNDPPP